MLFAYGKPFALYANDSHRILITHSGARLITFPRLAIVGCNTLAVAHAQQDTPPVCAQKTAQEANPLGGFQIADHPQIRNAVARIPSA